jgi:hypothetical protein
MIEPIELPFSILVAEHEVAVILPLDVRKVVLSTLLVCQDTRAWRNLGLRLGGSY